MRRFTLALYLAWLAVTPLQSTTLLPMDAGDLVDQAELIFVGVATEEAVATSKDGRYPFTFVSFEVHEVFKGDVAGDQLTLRFEGGELGDEFVQVHGIPEFERGREYLLFVAGNGEETSPVVGWGQGTLELVAHPSLVGQQVLVDYRGNAVEGIAQGGFLRSPIEFDASGIRRSPRRSSGVEVISESGVSISDPLEAELAGEETELVPAKVVIQSLLRTLKARAGTESFQAGKRVRSLSLEDVPEKFSYRSTDAGRQ